MQRTSFTYYVLYTMDIFIFCFREPCFEYKIIMIALLYFVCQKCWLIADKLTVIRVQNIIICFTCYLYTFHFFTVYIPRITVYYIAWTVLCCAFQLFLYMCSKIVFSMLNNNNMNYPKRRSATHQLLYKHLISKRFTF